MSSKPCPGCGEVIYARKATEVCWDCREKLDGYERLEERLREINERSDKTLKIIIGPVHSDVCTCRLVNLTAIASLERIYRASR